MNQDAEIDKLVKIPLATDMVNLIGIKPRKRFSQKEKEQAKANDINKGSKTTTVKDIQKLKEENYKSLLKAEDYIVLLESDEEYSRRGNFRRVFPTINNVKLLKQCFDVERPNNELLWKYLELKENGVNILKDFLKEQI